MIWEKKGLVWANRGQLDWSANSALTPTPLVLNDDVVRVFAGFRDSEGVSRIGYVDLESADPTRVVGVSKAPVLDVGRPGTFDDNGVILGHALSYDNDVRLYYVGFQRAEKVKFLAFTGLAISHDNGETFERFSETPVLDRADGALMFNAIHSMHRVDGQWRAWVGRGSDWVTRNGAPFPKYDIWEIESDDGITFSHPGRQAIFLEGDEYRIGRPSVYRRPDGTWIMFYTAGNKSDDRYQAGMALSEDGRTWTRGDDRIGLTTGKDGAFDNLHLCYPRLFEVRGKTWAVYNGNYMGVDGFGLAELKEW